ncbi:uncharacterized protein LOC143341382 [Colletes latitarsis]|uniref:uncharacterized protein LOC143341382 n=1 Tax=Colletes latitarsis TaxID=2605962 RepID=UPI004035EF1B
MSWTLGRETSMTEPTEELESDGSSCGDRGDAKKRVRVDADSTGPKKRRKQTTPVRFSSSLMTGANEDEEEDGDSEGKLSSQSPILDENLDNEFRCRYCSQFFDSKETLNAHLDNEHGSRQRENSSPNSASKITAIASQPEQSEIPVNYLTATNWQHVQSQNEPDPWPGSANQIAGGGALPNHLQAFTGALAQYLPLSAFPLTDSSGHMARATTIGSAPVRIFNPDAYCDLCNKEFCNKYFLKTHKANKHGIYVDSPGSSAIDGNAFVGPIYTGNVKLELPCVPCVPYVPCDLCQKRFKNEESMRKHKQKMHTELLLEHSQETEINLSVNEEDRETPRTRDSPGGMETLFKLEYGVEQEDATFVPAPRHLSPRSIQQARDAGFNADRLRRLGVINPDAFCEICCKEYCNKYFLRTHKTKRHGILVQDNDKSPNNPGSAVTWHQIQTSPLNLIVTESTTSSTESNDRPGDDYECKICGIRFQTIGLYRAHSRKMHESEQHRSPKHESSLETAVSSLDQQRNDSISEDLQKLQTMLLQLNGLKTGKESSCTVCGKECETRAGLHVHMVTEHAEDSASSPLDKSPLTVATSACCALCGKDYPNQDALGRHIAEEHQPGVSSSLAPHTPSAVPGTPATINSNSLGSQTTSSERKSMTSMTPTSSYCEICNKELCNKYFMKTHMQRMHGIEIENGAQIGGVICNICNKELCSKYFLRVHKHNTHGIVDENAPSTTKQEAHDATNTDDAALKPEQLGDLSHRYFTHFTEVCPICSRRFRSIKWLKAHLMGDHGKIGIDKWREMEQQYQATPKTGTRVLNVSKTVQSSNLKIPNGFEISQQIKPADYTGFGNQVLSNLLGSTSSEDHQLKSYRCSYCNFTTTVLPFLFLHERSHANSTQENAEDEKSLQCPICSQVFYQPEMLHRHLLAAHQFPALLSHFQPPMVFNNFGLDAERSNESKEKSDPETKEDRTENSPQQVTANQTNKPQRQDDTAVQVTSQGVYKCAQCGYATTNLNRIKKHVRKDHKTIGDPTDTVIAELSKTLREVANRHKTPACYAMPQDTNSNPDKTIMQPFLLEEQNTMQAGEESNSEKRFVPALVYLPVKSRIGNALTASFTLSPA